jgi:quercetin dioxygenase-like cupin family protein
MNTQRFINLSRGFLLLFTVLVLSHFSQAQTHHSAMNANDIVWGAGPAHLPAGVEAVLLDGNPKEAVPTTLRLKFPAGYEIPPHLHPTQENVTVISGTFYIGTGDTLDKTKGTALEPGGFVAIPAEHHHYAWVEEETIVQVHLTGPFAITYLNPEDDPRND